LLNTGGIINVIAFYIIAVPIGAVCTFHFKMANEGLWIAICSGSFFQCVALLFMLARQNWEELAASTKKSLAKPSKNINDDSASNLLVPGDSEEGQDSTE